MCKRQMIFAVYFVVLGICALALAWPGYPLFTANIEPMVLGLPAALMWNIAWVSVSFVAILGLYLATQESDP